MIDEHFPGFGDAILLSDMKIVVLDLQGITFMTSFGVRQWLRSMAAIPPTVKHLYLVGCPPIIVDQLNMILNFGGPGKIISLAAPFACTQCGASSRETIDVLAEGATIAQGQIASRTCMRCGGTLVLDDNIDSYFACLKKYGATTIEPAAAEVVARRAELKKVALKPPGQPVRAATVSVAPSRARSIIPLVALVVVLLAIAIGVYVLVGPS